MFVARKMSELPRRHKSFHSHEGACKQYSHAIQQKMIMTNYMNIEKNFHQASFQSRSVYNPLQLNVQPHPTECNYKTILTPNATLKQYI